MCGWEAVELSPTALAVFEVVFSPAGTLGGCTAAAGVVTGRAVDWAEWLPAVSKASTV